MAKSKVEKIAMTTDEQKICLALGTCRYLPGTFDKRLGNNLCSQASTNQLITESQKEWMYRLLYKYRKQLPHLYDLHKGHPHCTKKI